MYKRQGQGARQEFESGQAQEVQRNENVVPTLKNVSYTHLDVYKRQSELSDISLA